MSGLMNLRVKSANKGPPFFLLRPSPGCATLGQRSLPPLRHSKLVRQVTFALFITYSRTIWNPSTAASSPSLFSSTVQAKPKSRNVQQRVGIKALRHEHGCLTAQCRRLFFGSILHLCQTQHYQHPRAPSQQDPWSRGK